MTGVVLTELKKDFRCNTDCWWDKDCRGIEGQQKPVECSGKCQGNIGKTQVLREAEHCKIVSLSRLPRLSPSLGSGAHLIRLWYT